MNEQTKEQLRAVLEDEEKQQHLLRKSLKRPIRTMNPMRTSGILSFMLC